MSKKCIPLISVFLFLVLIVSCGPIFLQSPAVNTTETAFNRAIDETITARYNQQGNSGGELSTAFAKATAVIEDSTAQAILKNSSYPATATAAFPVWEELRNYGVSSFDGNIAWLQQPVTISLKGPYQYGYSNDYPQITAKDFVLAADITWNTDYGLSGCGYMFRSDGDKAGPDQLMLIISRSAYGTVIYSAMIGGRVINYQYYYPWTKDKSFKWENDSTNRVVIVARGNLIDLFTNGILVAEIDTNKPPKAVTNKPVLPTLSPNASAQQLQDYQQTLRLYQGDNNQISLQSAEAQRNYAANSKALLAEGFLSFAASSSSGTATCIFSNTWLFLFNQPPTPTPSLTPTFNGTELPHTTLTTAMPTLIIATPTFTPTLTFVHGPAPTAPPATSPPATNPPATAVPATP